MRSLESFDIISKEGNRQISGVTEGNKYRLSVLLYPNFAINKK